MASIQMDDLDEAMTRRLLSVAQTQDVDAFEGLFRHFAPVIKAYMARKTPDHQRAEELMQETMINVWRKAALFDPVRGNASAWIFTIARNVRIDAYRRNARPVFDVNDPAFVPDEPPPADDVINAADQARRLHEALRSLPKEQVDLIRMSFFDGATHSAIAEQVGIPLGTVKSRIRIAFTRLRALMDKYHAD